MKLLQPVLAGLAAGLLISQAAAAELLANPGLEGSYLPTQDCSNVTGAVAPGWFDNTCWDTARPQVRYAAVLGPPGPAGPHAGAAAQRLTLDSGPRAVLAQVLPGSFAAGTVLRTSLWMRAEQPIDVQVMLREPDTPFRAHGAKLATVGPQWTRYQFEGLSLGGEVMLLISLSQPGSVIVDDVSVQVAGSVATVPVPPAFPVPRSYFGMHFNDLDTPWPRLGLVPGTVRIWDAGTNRDGSGTGAQWADINGAPGVYDWSGLDARVAAARQRGAPLLYTLGGRTPAWASARPDAASPYGPGQCGEPASDALWADWVRAVAGRYRDQIQSFEVWNEPDLESFYCGRPGRLVELTRIARQVLASVAPRARLVSPGMSGAASTAWLDHFLSGGGGAWVDTIAHHFYVERRPEDLWHPALSVRRLVAGSGLAALPRWNTEQGFFDADGSLGVLSPENGAAFVARALLLNWAWGHERFYYYTWDNQRNRILFTGPDRRTLLAPGVAYREVAGWMMARVMESVQQDAAGNYIVTLRAANGSRARAMWNPDATVAFVPPTAWGVRSIRTVAGQQLPYGGGSLFVGAAPVLLEAVPTATLLPGSVPGEQR